MAHDPVTVCITRVVRPGQEAAFEAALHEFVQRSLRLPGQLGVHVLRPPDGSGSREYGIVRKFASRDALEAFRESPLYREWARAVEAMTEGAPRIEELCGLESWFTPPGAPLEPLPRWKMAAVTLLGVWPTSLVLGVTLEPLLPPWPWPARALVFAACMVGLLTWLVMPALTRLLHRWLHAAAR